MTTNATNLTPRIITRRNYDGSDVSIHSAMFGFATRTLNGIAGEFQVDKSNEKAATILKGCKATAKQEIANQLMGSKFIVDRSGAEIAVGVSQPGGFGSAVRNLIKEIVPTGENETFYGEADIANPDVREAIRYKILLKSILMYGQLIYVNKQDQNLLTFTVTGEQKGEGLVEAIFMGAAEEKDLFISIAETTNFTLIN